MLGEGGGRKLGHKPSMCQHVVATVERETGVCGRVGYLMPEIFPPVGRGGVVG